MISQLCGGEPFGAKRSMVNRAIGVTGNLCHFAVFDVDQDSAATVTHPTMTFDHGVIAVDLHFTIDIRKPELCHACSSFVCLSPKQKKATDLAPWLQKIEKPWAVHHPWLLIRREENLWEVSSEKVVPIIKIRHSLRDPSYGLS
jgi:hypothetical protein